MSANKIHFQIKKNENAEYILVFFTTNDLQKKMYNIFLKLFLIENFKMKILY